MTHLGKKVRVIREGSTLHRGIVVGETNSFLKVYDDSKDSQDASPETAEWFPIKSKNTFIEGLTPNQKRV
jgi:hypothetical protein